MIADSPVQAHVVAWVCIDAIAGYATSGTGTVIPNTVNNSGKFIYEGSFAFGNETVNTSNIPASALAPSSSTMDSVAPELILEC